MDADFGIFVRNFLFAVFGYHLGKLMLFIFFPWTLTEGCCLTDIGCIHDPKGKRTQVGK
jgi:hypothetical protein